MHAPTTTWVDLHLHSTASDGSYSPARLMEMAKARGLAAVALTDHDTVGGLAEAREAADRVGLELVDGIELEAMHRRGTMHILGYFVDPASATLEAATAQVVARRHARNEAIAARLSALGIDIDYARLRSELPGIPIGRPHIARELIRRRIVSSIREAFCRFLGAAAAAFVPREALSPGAAIAVVREAGGIASLAHPSRLGCASELELRTVVGGLCDAGLAAIEVYHPDHEPRQVRQYVELARRLGLAITGGSDFHALGHIVERGVGFGGVRVAGAVLSALRERWTAERAGAVARGRGAVSASA